jgi:ribose 5-phosphate isomerase B
MTENDLQNPEDKISKVYIGSDHRGFNHKQDLINILKQQYPCEIIDIGTNNTDSCNYTDIAHNGAQLTIKDPNARLILLCGSGTGMSIVANRYKGIRCAYGHKVVQVALARQHNDVNALAMSTDSKILDQSDMRAMVKVFMETEFEAFDNAGNPSRHAKRVHMIDEPISNEYNKIDDMQLKKHKPFFINMAKSSKKSKKDKIYPINADITNKDKPFVRRDSQQSVVSQEVLFNNTKASVVPVTPPVPELDDNMESVQMKEKSLSKSNSQDENVNENVTVIDMSVPEDNIEVEKLHKRVMLNMNLILVNLQKEHLMTLDPFHQHTIN